MGFQLLKNYIKNEKTCYFFNWIHNFIKGIYDDYLRVPKAGVEPARPNEHMALNHACLPIPALGLVSDLAGARTQDPLLKREMLYQLSYQVNLIKSGANILSFFYFTTLYIDKFKAIFKRLFINLLYYFTSFEWNVFIK